MRDYELLVRAARPLDVPVTLATNQVATHRPDLPANVRAGRISHAEFIDQLRRSTVVVVPLKVGIERSAGRQTYLNAMAMGKLVIVTDSPGVRDYIENRWTGLIIPADVGALTTAIQWALDPVKRYCQELWKRPCSGSRLNSIGRVVALKPDAVRESDPGPDLRDEVWRVQPSPALLGHRQQLEGHRQTRRS